MSEPSRDAHQIPRSSKACAASLVQWTASSCARTATPSWPAACRRPERWNPTLSPRRPWRLPGACEGLKPAKLYLPVGPRGDVGGGKRRALIRPAAGVRLRRTTWTCRCPALVTRSLSGPGTPGGPGPSRAGKTRQTSMTGRGREQRGGKGLGLPELTVPGPSLSGPAYSSL